MVRIGYYHDLGFSIGGGTTFLRLWRAANAATASFSAVVLAASWRNVGGGMPNRKCMDSTIDWEKTRCNSTEAPVSVPVAEWLDILKGGQMVISAFVVACVALMPGVLWSREWLC